MMTAKKVAEQLGISPRTVYELHATDMAEPLHTVTAGGQQALPGTGNAMGLVTKHLAKLSGTSNSNNYAGHSAMRTAA